MLESMHPVKGVPARWHHLLLSHGLAVPVIRGNGPQNYKGRDHAGFVTGCAGVAGSSADIQAAQFYDGFSQSLVFSIRYTVAVIPQDILALYKWLTIRPV